MLLDPQDDFQDGELPNGPTPMPPPQAMAPPPPDSIEALKQAQADADKKKAYLGVIGSIAQSMANRPSAYELYTGKKSGRPDLKGMSDAAAGAIQNPMDQQQKAFAYLKAKNEADKAQGESTFVSSLKDDNSPAAKAFKQTLISSGGDPAAISQSTAIDLYNQGYSPAKMAEIKAKSNVEFGDKAKLFNMEQAAKTRDKKELAKEKAGDKGESDYQKYVTQMENHAATLRGDDAAKLASSKLAAISSGRALVEKYKGREDEMPIPELSLLAADRIKSVTGVAPTQEEMAHMMPHNVGTKWANIKSNWTSNPEPANSGGWVKEAADDFGIQEKAARKILQNRQDQITSNPRLKPEDRERIRKMAVPPEFDGAPQGASDSDLLKQAALKEIERRKKNASLGQPKPGG